MLSKVVAQWGEKTVETLINGTVRALLTQPCIIREPEILGKFGKFRLNKFVTSLIIVRFFWGLQGSQGYQVSRTE